MNEETIVKRALVMVGKLLGVSVLWVALLSFVTVFVTERAVSSMPSAQDKAVSVPAEGAQDAAKKDSNGAGRAKNPSANAPNKPNG
jgi:hypothetical protein